MRAGLQAHVQAYGYTATDQVRDVGCEADIEQFGTQHCDRPDWGGSYRTMNKGIWKGSIHRERFHLTNEVSTHREHF